MLEGSATWSLSKANAVSRHFRLSRLIGHDPGLIRMVAIVACATLEEQRMKRSHVWDSPRLLFKTSVWHRGLLDVDALTHEAKQISGCADAADFLNNSLDYLITFLVSSLGIIREWRREYCER